MLFIRSTILVLVVSAFVQQANAQGPDLGRAAQMIVDETNQFRRQEERREVKVNPELMRTARSFADFMACTDKYGHTADGKQPSERATQHGYAYCIVAENIAWESNGAGFTTHDLAEGFIDGWKKSPEHRKNLLDPDLFDIGVAIAHSKTTGRYYAVQDFGRPKAKAIHFELSNRTDGAVDYTVDNRKFSLQPGYTRAHATCRPTKVEFPSIPGSSSNWSGGMFHPADGSRYVIHKDESGHNRVTSE